MRCHHCSRDLLRAWSAPCAPRQGSFWFVLYVGGFPTRSTTQKLAWPSCGCRLLCSTSWERTAPVSQLACSTGAQSSGRRPPSSEQPMRQQHSCKAPADLPCSPWPGEPYYASRPLLLLLCPFPHSNRSCILSLMLRRLWLRGSLSAVPPCAIVSRSLHALASLSQPACLPSRDPGSHHLNRGVTAPHRAACAVCVPSCGLDASLHTVHAEQWQARPDAVFMLPCDPLFGCRPRDGCE